MRKLFLAILTVFCVSSGVFAQGLTERSLRATETLQTDAVFRYQGVDIPVLDISYHEWSSDSVTWSKTYTEGDCYLRISNDVKDTWVGINVCGGSGTGTSQIDTVIVCSNGVCDTITTGAVTVNIPTPISITGSTTNLQTDTTHTHEITFYVGDLEDVDTTSRADGYVLKWNEVTQKHEYYPDNIGGGANLEIEDLDGTPSVSNVTNIKLENGHLTDNGAGSVTIDFSLEPTTGAQDFFRTDTVSVTAGDTFLTFDSPLPLADYIVANAYALYSNGERQNLSYDSLAVDGFRVLDIIGESEVHYLVIRNLDSLGVILDSYGKVASSSTDILEFLDAKTDDTTITVTSNNLHVLSADSIPEENVFITTDGSISSTMQDYLSHVGTPHVGSGAIISDLGNDSIAITEGVLYMKSSNSATSKFVVVTVAADTLYVPQDTNFIVLADYNGGSPYYRLQQSQPFYLYMNWDELPFASIVNLGDRIIENSFEEESTNPVYRSILSQINYEPVRYQGGLDITDEGARQFSVSVGAAIFANTSEPIYPINTSTVDTFTRVYYDAGWQRVLGETTVNNTHYNDTAQGLVALTSDYYTYKWLYYIKDAPNFWVVLDGQTQTASYSDATAITSAPALPPELNEFYAGAILVGKFIVQEGRTEFIKIQRPFDEGYGVPSQLLSKSYSFTSQGVLAGTFYVGGFYDVATADANLTQALTTQTYSAANRSHASHPFLVAGGAGTVDAGVVGLRVTGTRIEDNGTRTVGYADTIITDITSATLNQYYEAEKFIGTVTYQLIVISGTPTTYSFDFNYGLTKYDDFGNRDFDMSGLEAVGLSGASDATFNITLIHHNAQNWTYAATGFVITPDEIVDLQTIHNTEFQLTNGKYFAFKTTPISYGDVINGSDSEGIIVRIVCGANNSVQNMDIHINAREVE